MKTRRTYFLDYPCDLKRGREGDVRPQPARRRLVRQLAAPLLPAARLQGQVSAGRRHPELADARLVGGRRRVPAEHRRLRLSSSSAREHQGVLAGRTFAGRPDVESVAAHGLLSRATRPVGSASPAAGWARSAKISARRSPDLRPARRPAHRQVPRRPPRCDWPRTRRICPTTRSPTSTSPASTSSRRLGCRTNRAGRSNSAAARASSEPR